MWSWRIEEGRERDKLNCLRQVKCHSDFRTCRRPRDLKRLGHAQRSHRAGSIQRHWGAELWSVSLFSMNYSSRSCVRFDSIHRPMYVSERHSLPSRFVFLRKHSLPLACRIPLPRVPSPQLAHPVGPGNLCIIAKLGHRSKHISIQT